ncbi:MAG: MgtC/SapB family protein [Anaerovorax sp.]
MIHLVSSYLTEINMVSISLRLILAVFLSGIIGMERGANKQAAGFRTHILVCVGATLAMLTNQYIFENISSMTDPARLGAQVITGVGFLGVGTILVTGKYKIKGLTTAAGLWASACIGLAIGIGFYAGAIIASLLVFISLKLLPKLEKRVYDRSRVLDLYIEMDDISKVKHFNLYLQSLEIKIFETDLSKSELLPQGGIGYHICIRLPKTISHGQILDYINDQDGVYLVEQI